MTKRKTVIWAIGGIIALVLVYVVVIQPYLKFQQSNVADPYKVNLKEVACDVTVTNPRGIPLIKNGDLIIESANCQQQYVNSCGRFGIFSDTGMVRLEAQGGLGSGIDVKISEGASQNYNLNWCGSKLTKVFKLKLFNDENQNIQTKEVTLQ